MPVRETTRPPSIADDALLLAFRAFGAWPDDPAWSRLAPSFREHLEPSRKRFDARINSSSARARLAREHSNEARIDPTRVHPSWYVRALKRETPSVRRALASFSEKPLGPALRKAFNYVDTGPSLSLPPHPEALSWALTLASERLVGGPNRRENDPPIVRAIADLDSRGHYRLASAMGLAKLAFAGEDRLAGPRYRERFHVLHVSLPAARLELIDLAISDLASARRAGNGRNLPPRLGLVSIGRLLAAVEPHRAHWALQHLPYEAARQLGSHRNLETAPLSPDDVHAWEASLLRAAIVLLIREGRVDPLVFAEPGRGPGGRP